MENDTKEVKTEPENFEECGDGTKLAYREIKGKYIKKLFRFLNTKYRLLAVGRDETAALLYYCLSRCDESVIALYEGEVAGYMFVQTKDYMNPKYMSKCNKYLSRMPEFDRVRVLRYMLELDNMLETYRTNEIPLAVELIINENCVARKVAHKRLLGILSCRKKVRLIQSDMEGRKPFTDDIAINPMNYGFKLVEILDNEGTDFECLYEGGTDTADNE